MRRTNCFAVLVLLSGLVLAAPVSALAQIATGTIAGRVADDQGGGVPGATVTLVSSTRGTTIDGVTNESGDFVIPNIPRDTYLVRVTMDGFKTVERPNVEVSPGQRVVVPTLTISVGALNETVTVTGEAPLIQSQTGERSFTVSTEAIQELPMNSRDWTAFTTMTPGVVGDTRLGNVGRQNNNVMLDGVAIMDTGNNGTMLRTNLDAIGEIRILTQGYQAEFGRGSGMQITAVTKSGTNQFRGSFYDLERNSDWNSNSWVRMKNGDPKVVSKDRDWGYTLGGPIGKAGGDNNLFFFYSHEYRPRTTAGAINRFRVPTALERQGDFSQTRDNNGALFPFIRDASTGLPCGAADTRGCFADGGVLGRIPQNRLFQPSLNILNIWPLPNASGLNYNYETVAPEDKRLTQQPTIRVDYHMSNRVRLTTKYTGQFRTVKVSPGSIPGFNDTLQKFPFIHQPSATVDFTLSQSLFMEATYGMIQNELGAPLITPSSNRCNIGLCNLPTLFPDPVVDERYYERDVLEALNTPFFVDGKIMLPPTFNWGGRIANSPPNLAYPGFVNLNRTHNITVSGTKLAGNHTFKAGFYYFTAYKAENLGVGIIVPANGALNFQNDTNNPLDSGFGYANAALGIFSQYQQQSKFIEGAHKYKNVEWYLQDNWKVSNRFTLDYGIRFIHQQPQHDSYQQASNFFLDKWKQSDAPALYQAACPGGGTCASNVRQARDPRTGALQGTNSAVLIGTIVPGSGNLTNGIIQAGQGIAKENYTWPFLAYSPRIGAAYDISGTQTFVIRGNFGLFTDRIEGNHSVNQMGNPPISTTATVRNATLQNLGANPVTTVPQLAIFKYDADMPTSTQWSAGFQMALPWASAIDVSYVGEHKYNLPTRYNEPVDINAPDFGAAYLPQNQDPTRAPSTVPGENAVSTDLMRPIRGFGTINMQWPMFWTDYHSLQMSFNRRFRDGFQLGFNYTLGLSQTGTNNLLPANGMRLQHNADGTYSIREDYKDAEELLKDNGIRPHALKGHFIWNLPGIDGGGTATKVVGAIVNDWQVSGIYTGTSGETYDIGYSYNSGGSNQNLTGSPSYAARIRIVGDPGSGCSDNQYAQFNTAAFAGPTYNSLGLESGRNYMRGCFQNTFDFAIARNIRLGGNRQLQFRVDIFNAFNTVNITNRQRELQLNSPTDQTIRNPQYLADGSLNAARLTPRTAGFGAATEAADLRTIQVQIRLGF
ncbi:MAG TPA: carboxypeptidase-like regulatory domain-containing protein [Vicinamibacterales bacterium]|nr:carboxypeptidase-like regulatory domain-containing protein [Vicinamibacterales bacterium]